MKFAVTDDNSKESEVIKQLINEYLKERNLLPDISTYLSGEEIIKEYIPYSFDVIFMDIFMDGISGIEAAKEIRKKDKKTIIIFLTSSMEHMQDAFSCHAFDYIEKPITKEKLTKILDDAINVLPVAEKNLSFISDGTELRIRLSDLVYVSTSGHYTEVVSSEGGRYKPYISFKKISEQIVEEQRFLQINKCILVNMNYIIRFEGKRCCTFGGDILPVNVRNAKNIEQTWQNYMFSQLHSNLNRGGI